MTELSTLLLLLVSKAEASSEQQWLPIPVLLQTALPGYFLPLGTLYILELLGGFPLVESLVERPPAHKCDSVFGFPDLYQNEQTGCC